MYWNGSAVVKFNTDGSLSVGTTTIAGGFNYQAVATTSNILNIASSTGATVMRINNAGAVSIGTTSSPGFFTVMGTSTSNIAFFGATGGTGCALTATGALNCSSDASFKKNIDVTTYGLDAILSLSPKAFNWNFELDGATKTLGFIAQDVQGIVPELVTTDSNGKLALNQTGLIPLLVNAMKEMNAKIFSSATTSAITIEEITASSTISVDAKLKALGVNAKQANEMLAQLASSTSATSSTTTTETVTYSTSTQSIWTNASGTACAYNFENGCNLSSTTLVMIPATTTTSTTTETFVGKLIARIIGEVKAFFGKEIITEKICVGTANDKICLNKIQLESLLNANPPATTSNPSPASTSTPESTPIVPDTVPTTETTSAPAPEPTPEPAI